MALAVSAPTTPPQVRFSPFDTTTPRIKAYEKPSATLRESFTDLSWSNALWSLPQGLVSNLRTTQAPRSLETRQTILEAFLVDLALEVRYQDFSHLHPLLSDFENQRRANLIRSPPSHSVRLWLISLNLLLSCPDNTRCDFQYLIR